MAPRLGAPPAAPLRVPAGAPGPAPAAAPATTLRKMRSHCAAVIPPSSDAREGCGTACVRRATISAFKQNREKRCQVRTGFVCFVYRRTKTPEHQNET